MICICRYDLTVDSSDFKSTPLFFPWYLCRVPPTGYFPNIPDWFRDPFCLSHNIWCSPSVNTQNDWTMTLYFFFSLFTQSMGMMSCLQNRTWIPSVGVHGWANKRKGASKDGAPRSVRVWRRKAWKARTVGWLPFTHCCWPHLLHKQLDDEEESPNSFGRRKNRVKCSRKREYSAQPTPCSSFKLEEKYWHVRSCVFFWPAGGSMAQLSETDSVRGHP